MQLIAGQTILPLSGQFDARSNRLEDAETSYGQALDIYRQIHDRLGDATTLQALGTLRSEQGLHRKGEDTFALALAGYETIEERWSMAGLLAQRGTYRVSREDLTGFEDWVSALAIAKTVDRFLFETATGLRRGGVAPE